MRDSGELYDEIETPGRRTWRPPYAAPVAPTPVAQPAQTFEQFVPPTRVNNMSATAVKIQGLTSLLDKLAHGIGRRVDEVAAKANAVEVKADNVVSGVNANVIAPIDAELDAVNTYLDELNKATNGGPA